jgi:hypothetical protein
MKQALISRSEVMEILHHHLAKSHSEGNPGKHFAEATGEIELIPVTDYGVDE